MDGVHRMKGDGCPVMVVGYKVTAGKNCPIIVVHRINGNCCPVMVIYR
jgi:hypothetical protein